MKKKLLALSLSVLLVFLLLPQAFAYYSVPSDTVVYVTETGSCYHRWGCASLKSVAASYTVAMAEALGYYGCSHCDASRLTGVHTPVPSTSSSPSSDSSNASPAPDISQYLAQAEELDKARAENTSSAKDTKSVGGKILTVVCGLLLGAYLGPIIIGTLCTLVAAVISVFRKKTPVDTNNEKENPPF